MPAFMPDLNIYVATFLGLGFLVFFGDMLVQGAAQLGRLFKFSQVFMGVVVVGLGTSLPEIMTALMAVLKHQPGIATGNVVGSNIANILLILGTGLVLFGRQGMGFGAARMDYGAMVLATVLLLICAAVWGEVAFWQGGVLLLFLVVVLYMLMHQGKQTFTPPPEEAALPEKGALMLFGKTAMALVGLWLGSVWLVDGASGIAIAFGLPPAVVGLSVVALGTSLPELAATFSAYRAGHGEMILGNVLGSNIFNILAALGAAALMAPLDLASLWPSLGVVALSSVVILPLFVWSTPPAFLSPSFLSARVLSYLSPRFIGLLFLGSYIFYIYCVYR